MKLREVCLLGACTVALSACLIEPPRGGGQGYYEGGGRHHRDNGYGNGGYNNGYGNGYGHGGGYNRGDRWRGDGYEVGDWRGRPGLYEPPHGYHWVQNGDQFLLAAVATGIIAAVVLGH